ncbi:MAG: hypothetical protein ACKVJK_19560 [Methylophagaceae bacterium]|jgi:hypothetical protein|tara:strand:+ start:167 stop:475 length:309 start_codon:yes stop_codon:yes gene_type:complete
MSDVQIVRMVSGEEVIAKVVYEEIAGKGFYTLTDAILLVAAGEGKIGMVPYIPYSTRAPLVVSERHVMFVAEPMDELKKQVIEQTTGIIMPNSDLGGGLSLV